MEQSRFDPQIADWYRTAKDSFFLQNEHYKTVSEQIKLNQVRIEKKEKFDYAFLGLIFASLALSLQLSSNVGRKSLGFLLIAWIIYLASAIIGGIRIYINIKIEQEISDELIKFADKSSELEKDIDTKVEIVPQIVSDEEKRKSINEINRLIMRNIRDKKTQQNMIINKYKKGKKAKNFLDYLSISQFILYFVALIFNGIFIYINLLNSIENSINQIPNFNIF